MTFVVEFGGVAAKFNNKNSYPELALNQKKS
jgi:hypothetical protein